MEFVVSCVAGCIRLNSLMTSSCDVTSHTARQEATGAFEGDSQSCNSEELWFFYVDSTSPIRFFNWAYNCVTLSQQCDRCSVVHANTPAAWLLPVLDNGRRYDKTSPMCKLCQLGTSIPYRLACGFSAFFRAADIGIRTF